MKIATLKTGLGSLALLPGLAIMIIVLAFMMLASGLRDALDIKRQA